MKRVAARFSPKRRHASQQLSANGALLICLRRLDRHECFWLTERLVQRASCAETREHERRAEGNYLKLKEHKAQLIECIQRQTRGEFGNRMLNDYKREMEETTRDEFKRFIEHRKDSDPDRLARPLFDFQEEAVSRILEAWSRGDGFSLNDEMGCGKTAQSVAALLRRARRTDECFRALIVCPKAVLTHWEREVKAMAIPEDGLRIVQYHGPGRKRSLDAALRSDNRTTIVVTTTATIRNELTLLWNGLTRAREADCFPDNVKDCVESVCLAVCPVHANAWDLLVVDESHDFRSVFSISFQTLACLKYEKCLLLSGTPFNNSSVDLAAPCVLMKLVPPIFHPTEPGFAWTPTSDLVESEANPVRMFPEADLSSTKLLRNWVGQAQDEWGWGGRNRMSAQEFFHEVALIERIYGKKKYRRLEKCILADANT